MDSERRIMFDFVGDLFRWDQLRAQIVWAWNLSGINGVDANEMEIMKVCGFVWKWRRRKVRSYIR